MTRLASYMWMFLAVLALAAIFTGHPWHIATLMISIIMYIACKESADREEDGYSGNDAHR